MYTEEEVLSGSFNSSSNLTKLKVRVPENERKRLMQVKGQAKQRGLQAFLEQIN